MRQLAVGVGCSSAAQAEEVVALIGAAIAECGGSVRILATVEKRAGHPAIVAAGKYFDAEVKGFGDLGDAVAEPAALRFGPLLVAKRKSAHVTCAVAEIAP